MHHMDPPESSRLGDMRVNDVIKEIGCMKLSDVIEGIGRPILPGSEMGDVLKRIEDMPRDHVSIPIADLEKEPADRDPEYKLPRVPEWVRAVDPDAYTPKFICIGPYHRGRNGNPLRQENLKKDFVNRLRQFRGADIKICFAELRKSTETSRRFYFETFDDINDEEWAMMLLLDGCFFIMHLLNFSAAGGSLFEYPTNWVKLQVKIDLALLENQLPFFILEKIFYLFFTSEESESEFKFDISTMLRGMAVHVWVNRRKEYFKDMKTVKNNKKKVHHLVHLIHMAHCDLINMELVEKLNCGSLICTKIKKFIRYCAISLMMLLTAVFKNEKMTVEVVGLKKVAKIYEAMEAVEQALESGEKAMSAMEDAKAKASEAAENNKDKAAVAAVAAEAVAAVVNANEAALMAEKYLNKAEDAASEAEEAEDKAEEANAQAAVAKGKQKTAAMEKKAAAKAKEEARRAAADALAAKKKAADAWKSAVDFASNVYEAALEAGNMAGVADDAAKAAKEALKAMKAAAAAKNEKRPKENIASAMHLHHLGIKFVTTERTVGSQYHVRLSSNDEDMLVIPPVVVNGTTAPLLHNLIAFEQQAELITGDHFTKYAFLMYNLIDSDEDISLLQRCGILLNNYGTNEQVISYFKNLLLWNSRLPEDYGLEKQKKTPCCETSRDFRRNLTQWNCLLRCQYRNLTQWNCLLRCQGKADGSSATRPMAIVRALDALEARSKERGYQDWAEAKRYCNSPVQVVLLVTSILVFTSTVVQTVTSLSGR